MLHDGTASLVVKRGCSAKGIITPQSVTETGETVTRTGETVMGTGLVRCHAGMATLPRRHGNVVTPAWQRCYAGVATLLRRHGNVVTPAWQPTKPVRVTEKQRGITDCCLVVTAEVLPVRGASGGAASAANSCRLDIGKRGTPCMKRHAALAVCVSRLHYAMRGAVRCVLLAKGYLAGRDAAIPSLLTPCSGENSLGRTKVPSLSSVRGSPCWQAT